MSDLTNSNPLANADSLDDFRPRPKAMASSHGLDSSRAEKAITRQVAQEHGFVIDNLAAIVRAKRGSSGKVSKSHTLRLYIQDINRFQTWCNENNYSQARGFEIILDKVLNG